MNIQITNEVITITGYSLDISFETMHRLALKNHGVIVKYDSFVAHWEQRVTVDKDQITIQAATKWERGMAKAALDHMRTYMYNKDINEPLLCLRQFDLCACICRGLI